MTLALAFLLATLVQSPAPSPAAGKADKPAADGAAAEKKPEPPRIPLSAEDEAHLEALRQQIAGKEKEPSGTVFKDAQVFKEIPAERLLMAMGSFTRALGTTCAGCHEVKQWEADHKDKSIARRMMAMTRAINEEYLSKVPEFADEKEKPRASCMMCHRGSKHPKPDGPPVPKPAPAPAR